MWLHPRGGVVERTLQFIQVRERCVDDAKVRQVERGRLGIAQNLNGFFPCLNVNIWRRTWRNHRSAVNEHARHIARKNAMLYLICIVLYAMSHGFKYRDVNTPNG